MSVRTLHAPKVMGCTRVFFFLLFGPLVWDPRQPRSAGQGELRQAMFGTPFLVLSSCYGGEQCDPEEGCSVVQGAAESFCCLGPEKRRPYGLNRLCAGLRLQLPVYPHLLLRRSPVATGLW